MADTTALPPGVSGGRAVDRLISFSDGVVAVAITLMALPLVDIRPRPGQSAFAALADNAGSVGIFLFTFVVVAVMWRVHNRVLNDIRGYDGTVFWLNTAWLAAIVMLPWFSSMYGEESFGGRPESGGTDSGIGFLYWCVLALVSLLTSALFAHLRRRPELLNHPIAADSLSLADYRGLVFAGFFLITGLVSLVQPVLASFLPWLLIPISLLLRPRNRAST